jgi:hypothetical protein
LAKKQEVEPEQVKQKVNERKIPKRYLLTVLREGGYYEPITDEEFEKFKIENPDLKISSYLHHNIFSYSNFSLYYNTPIINP